MIGVFTFRIRKEARGFSAHYQTGWIPGMICNAQIVTFFTQRVELRTIPWKTWEQGFIKYETTTGMTKTNKLTLILSNVYCYPNFQRRQLNQMTARQSSLDTTNAIHGSADDFLVGDQCGGRESFFDMPLKRHILLVLKFSKLFSCIRRFLLHLSSVQHQIPRDAQGAGC